MVSTDISEVILTDEQIDDGCRKHVLRMSAVDEDTVLLTLDGKDSARLSRASPTQAQIIYGVFGFSRGAKYTLVGLDSYEPMDETVYKDFFALIREIVIGINALAPGPIDSSVESQEES